MVKNSSTVAKWRIFSNDKRYEVVFVPVSKLNTSFYVRPEDFFLSADRKRRLAKLQANNKFEVRTIPLDEVPFELSAAEKRAEDMVWNNEVALCDKEWRVFLHADSKKLSEFRGSKGIFVCRFLDPIDENDRIGLILRKLSKSSEFPTMARIETIRYAVDELNWKIETVHSILVNKGKNKFSKQDVQNEYLTAKVYEELCDFVTPTSGHSLSDHPKTFSRIKYFCGKKEVRQDMELGRERKEHWVNMAIMTTVTGTERFQDNVNRILRYPKPAKKLFEGSYIEALEELKSRHPEADTRTFPYHDLLAGDLKLKDEQNLKLVVGQIKKNPEGQQTLNVILSIINTIAAESPQAFDRIVRTLQNIDGARLSQLSGSLYGNKAARQ